MAQTLNMAAFVLHIVGINIVFHHQKEMELEV